MTQLIVSQDAVERLKFAQRMDMLKRNTWGDGIKEVCMMSAIVPGAEGLEDCVAAGWPMWLAHLCLRLFDSEVGAEDEQVTANEWAIHVAEAVSLPVDYNKARDLFILGSLQVLLSLGNSHFRDYIKELMGLVNRRLQSEDVTEEIVDFHHRFQVRLSRTVIDFDKFRERYIAIAIIESCDEFYGPGSADASVATSVYGNMNLPEYKASRVASRDRLLAVLRESVVEDVRESHPMLAL